MNENIAIHINNVSKTFKLPHERTASLKSAFINFYKRNKTYEKQEVLRNLSFDIKKGEFFGIVGRNGSGKSTLLKMLAGIYEPTNGEITVNGKLTPFIELGVGFNPELTGKENVYLNGALIGFDRKEMDAMYHDIVKFAELERFMDQKLKNYSSGMQVRLAFSIAIRAKSDILLIDEVLAVGDQNFQDKCFDYFEKLKKSDQTIILVSHDMSAIKKFCNRVALINNGDLKLVGSPDQVSSLYEDLNAPSLKKDSPVKIKSDAEITSMRITNLPKNGFNLGDSVKVEMEVKVQKNIRIKVGLNITDEENGTLIAGVSSQFQIEPIVATKLDLNYYYFEFSSDQFASGKYLIDGIVYDYETAEPIFFRTAISSFIVTGYERGWGALNLRGHWSHKSKRIK